MTIDFDSHRRKRENDPNKVRCAHCGAWILAHETRCPKCGVHFRGEAFQFAYEAEDEMADANAARRKRAMIIAALLVAILIAGTFLFFAGR